MKEQINVDKAFVKEVCKIIGMWPIAWDVVEPTDICKAVIEVYLDKIIKHLDGDIADYETVANDSELMRGKLIQCQEIKNRLLASLEK